MPGNLASSGRPVPFAEDSTPVSKILAGTRGSAGALTQQVQIISDTFLFGPALAYVWGKNFVLIADECALPDCNPARYCDWL